MNPKLTDATGKNAEQRFREIREYFLEMLKLAGVSRSDLYHRPKLGEAREPTEEEVVRRWAENLRVPVNDIFMGIQRAFLAAIDRGQVVTSFRYCAPQIIARLNEVREARAGQWPMGGG